MIGSKGLFGKRLSALGMGQEMPASVPDMRNVPTTAGGAFGNSMPAEAPARRGVDWKSVLLNALGGAADGAATFFGGQPLIAQQQQFQRLQAERMAAEQRQRAADLADYRTQLQIKQEFERPEGPKPGSFEWYQTATPEQRALYDQYQPVIATTWQGPVPIPRSQLGGVPSAPVGKLTPIEPNIRNTPAPQLGANGMPTTLTRQQYQAVVAEMGQAETDEWARRNNIRVVN